MASSLQELLTEEGFERGKSLKNPREVRLRNTSRAPDESVALPMYICHDRKSLGKSKHKAEKTVIPNGSSVFSSRRLSNSDRSKSKSLIKDGPSNRDEPAIDDVAIRAVISILGGYVGRYIKDESFREMIKEKCNSCLVRRKNGSDNGIFVNMELGIESIDKLVENRGNKKELRMKSLRNSIRLLSIVASLNSKKSRDGSTCGVPNSHLSACAQLYLSIVYKLEKNDRISARHLLQVFCDSAFLARTHLLPDLWEHFFLPHLLHLKVWYHKELEFLSNLEYGEKEKRMKALSKLYDDQIDMGTVKFAMYYKEWLKIGAKAPAVPTVPLPSSPSYRSSRRRSFDSYASHSSINKNLYRAVFGATTERQSMELDHRIRASMDICRLEEEENECTDDEYYNGCNYVHNKTKTRRRSSSQISRTPKTESWTETRKSDHFRLFTCQTGPTECLVNGKSVVRNNSTTKEEKVRLPLSDLSKAIATICSSDSLSDCEIAIRVMTKAWLESHADPAIETALAKAPVIEGILEVLFASSDDEILELAISILAEFVARNEVNRQIILNSDPQLEIFLRLLRNSSLFLKAAVLLYLLKPKAKQMISTEWVPLVLRVLEFGEQLQTLFTVRRSPQVAAFYFLDQLLTGFNEDRNLENATQVVSLGGLSLLIRNFEIGSVLERNNAALIVSYCIRADGSCRNYLADKLNKASLIELIVVNRNGSNGTVVALLAELLCLNRRTQITKFLNDLMNGWGGLNSMHILLACLQRVLPEERPLVAAILLQLDLLGDPLRCSVYREEAVEAIIEALDCEKCNEKIQEHSARALMMLGGRFSCMGEATTENWLLQQAGFHEKLEDSFHSKEIVDDILHEEEEAIEHWQRKAAIALLNSGNKRFLASLSNSMAKGIPSLARASLLTVSWMSSFLHSVGDKDFQSMACSILVPQLLESSNYNQALEERVLASFSLQRLIKSSGMVNSLTFSKLALGNYTSLMS
ncbi:putative E3 ubiquitin-protein ligase LIN-1 isoform X2 [Herrania umbratica]|uniref:E3 ubiquitin-protein ligase LIN-1 isoform X2 n=1 Tax=Herrania umbratica TaxID=108875 RepID=A0A6J1B6S5_9ROSI|nr:putative E3 ubiquitin-protein ligase LIN-1 isoform X2 [Herrania umbratica]